MRGCACCVVSGGQKYVRGTSAFPNHSALTFKAVTKLRRDSFSPWRHSFPNSADRGRRFCFVLSRNKLHTKLAHIANFVQMAFETVPFFKVSVHILMPIINTSLQKGCTSYYMPEISKNEIAILKSNHGSLTRLELIVCMRMYSGWNFSRYYRPSCYGLFNKDNLHEVHEGPQYDIFFSRMFLHLYKSTQ